MKDFITKIINSVLATIFALGFVVTMYHMTSYETDILGASILDGVLPSAVNSVSFVTPKGSTYPVNGVVTVQAVFVDATTDGVVSGSDLENSFITFGDGNVPCPGAVYNGNKIILSSTFSSSCSVAIYIDGTQKSAATGDGDLTIEPISCAALRTSLLRGYGEGFEEIAAADLGAFAITDNGGSFTGFDFGSITTSADLDYPVTAVDGAKTFQIHIELASDISADPINGIDQRAVITANNGNGVYEIKIRDEGTGNEVQTALNFAYVFNDLLGADSPFVAFPDNADPEVIRLQATEMGAHPNTGYLCKADGVQITGCFSGGADGQNEGLGVLTTPLKLDNEVLQGESAIVFAANSSGEIDWISSHPSILEVATLTEASGQDEGVVDFVDELLDDSVCTEETTETTNASYNVTDCTEQFDQDDNFVSEVCTIEYTIPVRYHTFTDNYTVNVTIEDEVVPVTVSVNELNGVLTGTSSYSTLGGASVTLTGSVSGVVTGTVSGLYSGSVSGQITAPLTATATVPSPGAATKIDAATIKSSIVLGAGTPIEGVLTDIPGTFTSTVKKQETDVSHVAILYGKRPGTSILSAMDKEGCIASFEVEVIEKQVILQMVGRDPGDVLDVSDTVQINAYAGGANGEIEEYENITAASGIEYFSSNEDVATIDETGLLTALKPGVTNITARYDTGEAEIGTIESLPLQVTVNKIAGLRVTFDKGTEDLLPAATVEDAYKSVVIAVHTPEAAGHTLYIEGQTVNIVLPAGTYNSNIAKVTAIAGQLQTDIDALVNSSAMDIVNVTTVDGYPGILILQPHNQDADNDSDSVEDIDENGIIDVSTSALEDDFSILPTYTNAIPLPSSKTYGLMVMAQYDNGATKILPPTQFNWVNTPLNYLEQASLDSGLIKLGDHTGTSTVVAEYENADGSVVQSNYLTITVDSGPAIEYVRRIGSSPVTKGSRITLQTKISDVDTVDDITAISTSLVYSTFSTYQQINADSGAIWFTATPFLNEMAVVDQGSTEEDDDTESSESVTVALQYKTYNIPVEIPTDANLFDGVYKLVLSVTDASNHTLNYVYPIRIGNIAGGDVNDPPDGVINMVDVILAFQIAAGINLSPTPYQLQAANVDGVGGVTLVDVILLFNSVTNKD